MLESLSVFFLTLSDDLIKDIIYKPCFTYVFTLLDQNNIASTKWGRLEFMFKQKAFTVKGFEVQNDPVT